MQIQLFVVFVCGAFLTCQGNSDFQRKFEDVMVRIMRNETLRAMWYHQHLRRFEDSDKFAERLSYTCENLVSESVPLSVHQLLPSDIKVVAAMGDSLTAGNGILAWTILGCLTEYRGHSWSIGGDKSLDRGVTTVPNILRNHNADIIGSSTGSGDENSRGAKLNVAVAGAIAQDMPSQARNLVNKLNSDPNINVAEDWKLVTLFIGGNNLCAFCEDEEKHSAQAYINNIKDALDILHAEVPRVFVNLVEIFDIGPVADLATGPICGMVHSSVCSCPGEADKRDALIALTKQYQKATEDLVESGRYDTREDFTVVLQPFFKNTEPPKKANGDPDMSYFSPDCFHFSKKGQAAAAKGLWNNMFQPVGQKSDNWDLAADIQLTCPTGYLATVRNG